MWCTVYRLYLNGSRLTPEQTRATGMRGWLTMYSKIPGIGTPHCRAHLLPDPSAITLNELIAPLEHCHLQIIKSGGIRLNGQDYDHSWQYIRQAWWIVPDGQPTGDIDA